MVVSFEIYIRRIIKEVEEKKAVKIRISKQLIELVNKVVNLFINITTHNAKKIVEYRDARIIQKNDVYIAIYSNMEKETLGRLTYRQVGSAPLRQLKTLMQKSVDNMNKIETSSKTGKRRVFNTEKTRLIVSTTRVREAVDKEPDVKIAPDALVYLTAGVQKIITMMLEQMIQKQPSGKTNLYFNSKELLTQHLSPDMVPLCGFLTLLE